MSWNPLNIFKSVNKAIDIVDQVVEDKDAANLIKKELELSKDNMRLVELSTKTVPWVDALHKMSRFIISMSGIIGGYILIALNPDIDLSTLAAVMAPGGIYNYVKGKGK